jgi:purine-nucleoside/S-methyl-5'-thioadenosine phosphorylase / adenosine deaminase
VTFFFRDTVATGRGTVEVGFTDHRLDLGDRVPAEVRKGALAEIAGATGATPYLMHQVHGSDVHLVEDPRDPPPPVDALVTREAGIALLARAADCVPVLLASEDAVIGAVHAGRLGVRDGVVTAALDRVRALGGRQVRAWVGPHICGRCYEVPEEMRAEVARAVPTAYAETRWGTPSLDLGAGVRSQLEAAGCAVVEVGRCTLEDPALHSHRRDGAAAGRLAGAVWRTG